MQKKADEAGILSYIVMDAGRTQIASGTKTVMALGPGATSSYDIIVQKFDVMKS